MHRSDATAMGPIDQRLIAPLRDLGSNDFCQLIRMFLDEAAGRVARLEVASSSEGETPDLARRVACAEGDERSIRGNPTGSPLCGD